MDTYLLEYESQTYDAVDVTVFPGTENGNEVTVSTTDLKRELEYELMSSKPALKAQFLYNSIACWVEPEDFELDEEKFTEMIEEILQFKRK